MLLEEPTRIATAIGSPTGTVQGSVLHLSGCENATAPSHVLDVESDPKLRSGSGLLSRFAQFSAFFIHFGQYDHLECWFALMNSVSSSTPFAVARLVAAGSPDFLVKSHGALLE